MKEQGRKDRGEKERWEKTGGGERPSTFEHTSETYDYRLTSVNILRCAYNCDQTDMTILAAEWLKKLYNIWVLLERG